MRVPPTTVLASHPNNKSHTPTLYRIALQHQLFNIVLHSNCILGIGALSSSLVVSMSLFVMILSSFLSALSSFIVTPSSSPLIVNALYLLLVSLFVTSFVVIACCIILGGGGSGGSAPRNFSVISSQKLGNSSVTPIAIVIISPRNRPLPSFDVVFYRRCSFLVAVT